MSFGRWGLAVLLATAPGWAQAQEGAGGCASFRWPLESERAALARADKPSLANGGALAPDVAMTLELAPLSAAGLPKPPERAPKSPQSFGGHFTLPALAKPGVYKITLSSPAWIDVLDGDAYVRSSAFSYAIGCEGARKSVKFDLPARPLAIQFSDAKDDRISVIVSPDQ